MANFLTDLFSSKGLKRRIASYLSLILEFLRQVPGLAEIIHLVEGAAGVSGLVGVSHAIASETVTKKKVLSLGALLAVVISLSHFIPALAPLIPILQKLAAALGAIALGQKSVSAK